MLRSAFISFAAASALCATAPSLSAQARVALLLDNPTSSGSTRIPCSVWMPPAASRPAPWPLVSLLHGHGFAGKDYEALGRRLASSGFLVVAPDNNLTDGWVQGLDALALPAAVASEAKRATSPLFGKLDGTRRAVIGHSMGAANVVRVLAEDASYRVGIALTPIFAPQSYSAKVRTPLVLIGAEGDSVTPWRTHLLGIRSALSPSIPAWTTSVFGRGANHLNPVFRDFVGSTDADDAIFDATFDVVRGALLRWLENEPAGLDAVVGMAARGAPALTTLEHRFGKPEHFSTRDTTEFRLHVAGPDGPVLEFGSFGRAQIPTVFGVLEIDPVNLLIAPPMLLQQGVVTTLRFPRGPQFRSVRLWSSRCRRRWMGAMRSAGCWRRI